MRPRVRRSLLSVYRAGPTRPLLTYVLYARRAEWSVCPWEASQVDAIVEIIAGAHWTEVEENAGLYRAVYL
jgi:hypothetical protein